MKRKYYSLTIDPETTYGYLWQFNAYYDTDLGVSTTADIIPRAVVQVAVPYNNLPIFLKFLKDLRVTSDIKKVIFNGPATIILWDDGTKTVVKCKEGDPYSKEAGFALCLLKKMAGDDFHKVLRFACEDKEKK